MTWKLLGIDRENGSGAETQLPAAFTDDTALEWFAPERALHGRLWKLDDDQVAEVSRTLDTALKTRTTDYYVMRGVSWKVDVFNEDDDRLAIVYRLPPSFGFVDAARWTGARYLDAYGGEYELGKDQVAELGEIFAVHADSERYAYFLGATGAGGSA